MIDLCFTRVLVMTPFNETKILPAHMDIRFKAADGILGATDAHFRHYMLQLLDLMKGFQHSQLIHGCKGTSFIIILHHGLNSELYFSCKSVTRFYILFHHVCDIKNGPISRSNFPHEFQALNTAFVVEIMLYEDNSTEHDNTYEYIKPNDYIRMSTAAAVLRRMEPAGVTAQHSARTARRRSSSRPSVPPPDLPIYAPRQLRNSNSYTPLQRTRDLAKEEDAYVTMSTPFAREKSELSKSHSEPGFDYSSRTYIDPKNEQAGVRATQIKSTIKQFVSFKQSISKPDSSAGALSNIPAQSTRRLAGPTGDTSAGALDSIPDQSTRRLAGPTSDTSAGAFSTIPAQSARRLAGPTSDTSAGALDSIPAHLAHALPPPIAATPIGTGLRPTRVKSGAPAPPPLAAPAAESLDSKPTCVAHQNTHIFGQQCS